MTTRYFLSTSGVRLPLRMVNEIAPDALSNRNTFIRAEYDADGRLLKFEKFVYGDIELTHIYAYDAEGALSRAEILLPDEDPMRLDFPA
jgi:hypothetical protein